MSCLCLGPSGAGKTLLLKRLQQSSVVEIAATVETVGTNIVPVPRKPLPKDDKNRNRNWVDDKMTVGIREVGGTMSPLWPSYFAPNKLIVYVIDSSNLFQVSIATVLLMEMLSHEKLVGTKFLVVLAKKDMVNREKLNQLRFMMRLESIVEQSGKRLTVVEASSISGEGIEAIRKWIDEHWKFTKLPG